MIAEDEPELVEAGVPLEEDEQSTAKPARRREPKALRREQLILATINSIASRGYSATTMAHVSDGAGLSRGIVNFHFESKEKLFVETLQYMANEYTKHWQDKIAKADQTPASKMLALIQADFDELVCNTRKISTWTAFRAEAVNSIAYRDLCWSRDEDFLQTIYQFCEQMKEEVGYDYNTRAIASAIYAMQEGLWLRLMLESKQISRKKACATAVGMIGTLFPQHFYPDGRLRNHKEKS